MQYFIPRPLIKFNLGHLVLIYIKSGQSLTNLFSYFFLQKFYIAIPMRELRSFSIMQLPFATISYSNTFVRCRDFPFLTKLKDNQIVLLCKRVVFHSMNFDQDSFSLIFIGSSLNTANEIQKRRREAVMHAKYSF